MNWIKIGKISINLSNVTYVEEIDTHIVINFNSINDHAEVLSIALYDSEARLFLELLERNALQESPYLFRL